MGPFAPASALENDGRVARRERGLEPIRTIAQDDETGRHPVMFCRGRRLKPSSPPSR